MHHHNDYDDDSNKHLLEEGVFQGSQGFCDETGAVIEWDNGELGTTHPWGPLRGWVLLAPRQPSLMVQFCGWGVADEGLDDCVFASK